MNAKVLIIDDGISPSAALVRELHYAVCEFSTPVNNHKDSHLPHFNHHSNRTFKGKGKPVDNILPKKFLEQRIATPEQRNPPSPFVLAINNAAIAKQQLERRMQAFLGLGISFKTRAMRSATAFTVPAGGGSREVKRRQRQLARGMVKANADN